MTITFSTFNGNLVTGNGATYEEAKEDAKLKAAAMGTCIRKRVTNKQQ